MPRLIPRCNDSPVIKNRRGWRRSAECPELRVPARVRDRRTGPARHRPEGRHEPGRERAVTPSESTVTQTSGGRR